MSLLLHKTPARAARVAGKMNKMEEEYSRLLEADLRAGVILHWWFEPFGLRLGEKCFYHPDFLVQRADGVLEVHEVKGHWEDDARVKIRAAAAKFPFVFVAIRRVRKGVWHWEKFTKEEGGTA